MMCTASINSYATVQLLNRKPFFPSIKRAHRQYVFMTSDTELSQRVQIFSVEWEKIPGL